MMQREGTCTFGVVLRVRIDLDVDARTEELLRELIHRVAGANVAEQLRRTVPSNDSLIEQFLQGAKMKPVTARAVVGQVKAFAAATNGEPLLAAKSAEIRRIAEARLSRCRFVYVYPSGPARAQGLSRCRKGLFGAKKSAPPSSGTPAFCGAACALYEPSKVAAWGFLRSLRSFYQFFVDREQIARNPVTHNVRTLVAEEDVQELLDRKFCPSLQLVRELVRTVDPAGRMLVVLAAKSGRRPGELRRIEWRYIDFERGLVDMSPVRETRRREAGRGNTKMHRLSCRWIFLDDEMLRALREYRTWWNARAPRDETGVPTTDSLWLNNRSGGCSSQTSLNYLLDRILKERGLWERHGLGAAERLEPYSFRHFFTTALQTPPYNAPRDLVKWMRGDSMGDAMQIYEHKDPDAMRPLCISYLPRLLV